MSLTEPVLTGPGAGRTVTKSSGSSTELKLVASKQAATGPSWSDTCVPRRAADPHPHTQRLVRAGRRVLLDHEAGIAVVDEAATGDEAVALTRDYSRTSCCWT
jgi:hypothetical protein